MKKRVSLFLLALVSIFLNKGNAHANNHENYGIGATAASLGGAFTARADDPFAVFYNPAGLIQSKKTMISVGAMLYNPVIKLNNLKSNDGPAVDFEDESPTCPAPHLGFITALNDKFSFGVAAYVPFGLALKWDNDETVNPGAYNAYDVWYTRKVISPGLAYKINDKLSVGASLSIGTSETGRKRVSQQLSALLKERVTFETDLKDDFNLSYNLGIMYKPSESLTLGLTYRSRGEADFKGETDFTVGSRSKKYDVEMKDIDQPEQIQAGARYVFSDRLSVEADIVWTHWSFVNKETIKFKNPDANMTAILKGDRHFYDRNWEDVTQIKIGVEYKVSRMLTLRCGYYNDPSPVPDESFDLEWPDVDKHTYTLGAGFNFENWKVDTAVTYSKSPGQRTITALESDNMDHSYLMHGITAKGEGSVFGVGATLSYLF